MDLNIRFVLRLVTISSMKADERYRWLTVVSGISARIIAISGDRRARYRNSVVSNMSFFAVSFSIVSFFVVFFSVESFSVVILFSVILFFVWEHRLRYDRYDMD